MSQSIPTALRRGMYILDPALVAPDHHDLLEDRMRELARSIGVRACDRLDIDSTDPGAAAAILIALAVSGGSIVLTPALAHLGTCAALVRVVADIYTGDNLIIPATDSWAHALDSGPTITAPPWWPQPAS